MLQEHRLGGAKPNRAQETIEAQHRPRPQHPTHNPMNKHQRSGPGRAAVTTKASPQSPPQRRHRATSKWPGPSRSPAACHLPAMQGRPQPTRGGVPGLKPKEVYAAAQRAEPGECEEHTPNEEHFHEKRHAPPPAYKSQKERSAHSARHRATEAGQTTHLMETKPHGQTTDSPWPPSSQKPKTVPARAPPL